jgi:hypothetical protein
MTWWTKYFVPIGGAVLIVGEGVWFGFINGYGGWKTLLLFCILAALVAPLAAWQGLSLKQIRMDEDSLYISNMFREIRVPLSSMEHVSEFLGMRQGNRVTITLRDDTPFGRTIVFMPPLYGSRRGKMNPIVAELRAHIRSR